MVSDDAVAKRRSTLECNRKHERRIPDDVELGMERVHQVGCEHLVRLQRLIEFNAHAIYLHCHRQWPGSDVFSIGRRFYSGSDADTNPNPHTNPHTNTHSNPDSDTNPDANAHTHSNPYTNADTNPNNTAREPRRTNHPCATAN